MKKYKITLISDTHNKHKQITQDLLGGDILIHSGDISSMGYEHEIREFCKWFNSLHNYTHKIFIAGNHDFGFQDNPTKVKEILELYPSITYLQDNFIYIGEDSQDIVKIYGSPWQPRFHNWAFNADPGEDIQQHWNKIPNDTDILITHGPAFGYLDTVIGRGYDNLGCKDLNDKIAEIKPKIHVCGHIHSGHGHKISADGSVHFFNASVLSEEYTYKYKPITFEWSKENNEIVFM
jgi:Icc-related predicted phosphoesterase